MKLASRSPRDTQEFTQRRKLAKTYKDYEEAYKAALQKSANISVEQKNRATQRSLIGADNTISRSGLNKVGQQFVGPILVRLKYQGILRDMLVEKPLGQGDLPVYPIWNNIGYAFALNDYSGEVQTIRMEGQRFSIPLIRIAQRVVIPKADVYSFNYDIVERAKQQMLENIMRKEDQLYFYLLDSNILNSSRIQLGPEYYNYPSPDEYSIGVTGAFTHMSFANAYRVVSQAQLYPSRVPMNVGDYYDIFNWGVNTLSYAAVERITDTGVVPNYGPGQFKPSVVCPKGTAYVQPDPEYVGYTPIRYSVQVAEVHQPEDGLYGWVADEMIGFGIANMFGVVRLRKMG